MDVRSESPLSVGSLFFRLSTGAWTLMVVAKATFSLAPGRSPLLRQGGDPMRPDTPWEPLDACSLRFAADLIPYKRYREVLLSGSAYAAHGRPIRSLVARLSVGNVDKSILVRGDSHFELDGKLSEPAPWTWLPLRWERAAGGAGTFNPAGVPTGTNASFDEQGRYRLPNLLAPRTTPIGPFETLDPVGYGPISADWPVRRARIDKLVEVREGPLSLSRPLPDGFDAAYFNAAPPDQYLKDLQSDEPLFLEHLHKEAPRLETRLEKISPLAFFDLGTGHESELPLLCDTLFIDTDRGIATLTFRGHLTLDRPDQTGSVVFRLDGSAPPLDLPLNENAVTTLVLAPPLDLPLNENAPATLVLTPPESERASRDSVALPFRPAETAPLSGVALGRSMQLQPAQVAPEQASPEESLDFAETPYLDDSELVLLDPQLAADDAISVSADDLELVEDDSPPGEDIESTVTTLGQLREVDTLPFSRKSAVVTGFATQEANATLAQILHVRATLAKTQDPAPKSPLPFVPAPSEPGDNVAPPPLWGKQDEPEGPPEADAPAADAPEEQAPAAPEPESEEPKELPVEVYSVERCGAISASLEKRPGAEVEILKKEGLDPETWSRLVEHWDEALQKELVRQKNGLLRSQDNGYVERLEEERGPISAFDYAKLAVAADLSKLGAVAPELDLPEQAWARIRRVWIGKMAKDPRLAALVRSLMDQEE